MKDTEHYKIIKLPPERSAGTEIKDFQGFSSKSYFQADGGVDKWRWSHFRPGHFAEKFGPVDPGAPHWADSSRQSGIAKSRYKDGQKRLFHDRQWLEQHFIHCNMTAVAIAKLIAQIEKSTCAPSTVSHYIRIFGLKQRKSDGQQQS